MQLGAREAEADANARAPAAEKRMMPCPGKAAMAERMRGNAPMGTASWAPGPLGALLSRLGLNRPHFEHMADSAVVKYGKGKHHGEQGSDHSIFVPEDVEGVVQEFEPALPIMEGGVVHILPIEGSSAVGQASDDDDDHHHKSHHKEHKHKEHKHKEHKHKDHKHKEYKAKHKGHKHGKHHSHKLSSVLAKWNDFSSRICAGFANLPLEARLFVFGALIAVLQVFFSLIFLAVRLRRGRGREARREARRQRRDARRQAKAAYKAGKAALKQNQTDAAAAKQAEAGFAIESEEEGEALPSYADGETDQLVERR